MTEQKRIRDFLREGTAVDVDQRTRTRTALVYMSGEELFARHIHERSARAGALVDVNCGALPQEIADSLLFGHRRGAFTGAVESVSGHLERANGGTLFLDE